MLGRYTTGPPNTFIVVGARLPGKVTEVFDPQRYACASA